MPESGGEPAADSSAPMPDATAAAPEPAVRTVPKKRQAVRRVSKPRLTGPFDSPVRNLAMGVAFTLVVMAGATVGYMSQGWSFRDAIYMVIITIYTVGYNEIRPIDTPELSFITMTLVVLGCTTMLFLTGVLVQLITQSQINKTKGHKRMSILIDQLQAHVILCGFGRFGSVLARSLSASSAGFVIVEGDEVRVAEARQQGYLCLHGDATTEATLQTAGVARASALATVLSNDALNVFITLTARALNPNLLIVARGELPSTERKLLQAGADKVVLPTHIGAERIAELLLHEDSARLLEGLERSHGFQRVLHNFGIELEVVTAAPQSPAAGMTVASIERQAKGAFFIVQINRRDGDTHTAPPQETVVGAGDAVVLIGRPNRSALLTSLFEPRVRTGVRG